MLRMSTLVTQVPFITGVKSIPKLCRHMHEKYRVHYQVNLSPGSSALVSSAQVWNLIEVEVYNLYESFFFYFQKNL